MNDIKQYIIITINYWSFTITDSALRMLIILHFFKIGYTPIEIASLFLFYEFFGIITNLLGGWIGTRIGLKKTMNIGLGMQIFALFSLSLINNPQVIFVMLIQAISGIAKDLNKMSAKSSIKVFKPKKEDAGSLYKWVAILTGSKNALKGAGFFIGSFMLSIFGFKNTLLSLAIFLVLILSGSIILLKKDTGIIKNIKKISEIFSKSRNVNILSGARFFLFGARDIWFVIGLPVFLQVSLGWSYNSVGIFFALWVIGYGIIQTITPIITGLKKGIIPGKKNITNFLFFLMFIPLLISFFLNYINVISPTIIIISGLSLFGILFAINSSIHSFLILHYSKNEGVSLNVGFYYMANASGRLTGTILSGFLFQTYGLTACLIGSSIFLLFSWLLSQKLPE